MVKLRCYGKHEGYGSYQKHISIQMVFSENIYFKLVGGISQFPQFFGIIPVKNWLYNILLYLDVIIHIHTSTTYMNVAII